MLAFVLGEKKIFRISVLWFKYNKTTSQSEYVKYSFFAQTTREAAYNICKQRN